MKVNPQTVLANKIVELMLAADSFTLDHVANQLVRSNRTKADILEFALGVAQQELHMAHGFSKKINQG